ncbi:DUF5682 family protein [Dactylosporangium siamense]|uniref:Uncharacterized protein n=1 Tax=Dactylosporangium siamense TaxID=685454 RepID=A0A919PZE1_9ACTN|nr:DUF5682 family protein [Dactylosporangium siamense]GIG51095.1 hypothetical protein Dsi01nite_091360 [Dactylosporangium siamense]
MTTTFIGVRHHSPACARLVADTIRALRPAHVLVEGPADMNDRVGELLLGHDLPVAVFSSYRDDDRQSGSWAPFCAYSPEWVALQEGHRAGARVRFIDLPSWDPALAERQNRYADAEQRYAEVVDRLCATFAVDNVDALWDHLFEIPPADGLAERLAAYFDLLRGETPVSDGDTGREAYMARWIRAAAADAGERPVVVVTGGFHRPALIRLTAGAAEDVGWPDVPALPEGAVGGSYLVPYSFRRLDAFDGYQSGMPSPEYYQQLWENGPRHAADQLVTAVVGRLRDRKQQASTSDLIAASASAAGLALVRGHQHPGRTDILDGLAGALVHDALDEPLPWATRGRLRAGTHPVVVEMVAALSGSRVGRLHPSTPLPPLVHDADADLEREGLNGDRTVTLALTTDDGLRRSRLLHRLRVLRIPGFTRRHGPRTGVDPVLDEHWDITDHEHRLVALIEAGAYGATLEEAAAAALAERIRDADVAALADALFDAALCGTVRLSGQVLRDLDAAVGGAADLGALGRLLAVVLTLWRHDRLLGTAGSEPLGAVITAAQRRALWLAEGVRGATIPAEPARIDAVVAVRDTMVHAGRRLGLDPLIPLEVMRRVAADVDAPPDLRGAAFGFAWAADAATADPETTGSPPDAVDAGGAGPADEAGGIGNADPADDPGVVGGVEAAGGAGGVDHAGGVHGAVRAVRGAAAPATVGDWLAGLFAVAREEVLHAPRVLDVLDDLVSGMGEAEFLIALPALRQAFTYFPPRERETVAGHLLARRGIGGPGRALLRPPAVDPVLIAAAKELEARVDAVLIREGLLA